MVNKRMLYICIVCILLVSIVMGPVAEAAVSIKVTTDVASNGFFMVNVDGHTDNGQATLTMTVRQSVYQNGINENNIASRIFYIGETPSSSDGTFRFRYPMSDSCDPTEYTIIVYSGNDVIPAKGSYVFVSKNSRKIIVDTINGELYNEGLLKVLEDKTNQLILSAMGIEISAYNNIEGVYKTEFCNILLEERSKGLFNETTLKLVFNAAITVLSVNKAQTALDIEKIIEERGQSLGIEIGEGSDYDKILKAGKGKELFEYLLVSDGHPYQDIQKFIDRYNERTALLLKRIRVESALHEVNSADYGSMETVLVKYNDIFLIEFNGDFTSVEELDKPLVYKALVGKGFNLPEKVKEEFDTKVEELTKPKTEGSSSGGGRKASSVAVVSPVVPLSMENQIPQITFNDIQNVPWAKEAIEFLTERKIVSGTENNCFAPDEYITREQFVKILLGAFGLVEEEAQSTFEDSNKDAWYYRYIASAQKLDIIHGIDETHFGVGRNITRQDMAVMVYRTAVKVGLKLGDGNTEAFEDDGDIGEFAKTAIYNMRNARIINGLENNRFIPQQYSTRAQAAVVIYNLVSMDK